MKTGSMHSFPKQKWSFSWLKTKTCTIPRVFPAVQTKATSTWPTSLFSLLNFKVMVRLIFILPINAYFILKKDQFKVIKDNITSKQRHWKEDKAFTRCNSFEKQLELCTIKILHQSPSITVISIQNYSSLLSKWVNQHSSTLAQHKPKKNRNTSYADRQATKKHQGWGSHTFSLATKWASQVISPGTHPCCSSYVPPLLPFNQDNTVFHRVILEIGLIKQFKLKIAICPPNPNPRYCSNGIWSADIKTVVPVQLREQQTVAGWRWGWGGTS